MCTQQKSDFGHEWDFTLKYRTIASSHEVGIECQDRERWDSSIVDKILAIRSNSHHNRFWYVFRDESFLTDEALTMLDSHGIMHFSLMQLRDHLIAIKKELIVAETSELKYKAPKDPAMVGSPPKNRFPFLGASIIRNRTNKD